MLAGMQEQPEYDLLFWTMYGVMTPRRREKRLRALRAQALMDLTDAESQVTALRHRLVLIDNAINDYMLGGKQGG